MTARVLGSLQDMMRRSNRNVRELEHLWRGAKSYGSSADVFTGNFASGVRSVAKTGTCLQTFVSGQP